MVTRRSARQIQNRRLMAHDIFTLAMERVRAHGKSYNAARKVMCEGSEVVAAARTHQTSKQNVHLAINRIRKAYDDLGICPYCGSKMPEV